MVLGNSTRRDNLFAYKTVTFCGYPFQDIRLKLSFVTPRLLRAGVRSSPVTPHTQRARAMTCMRFRLFPVRSPLLRESRLLSLPLGTEMVHFPRFVSTPYGFRCGYLEFIEMGFPIRKSPDQSLFSGSPELIAASHVLHHLPAPRHPPYALSNLTIKFSQDKKTAVLLKLSKNLLDLSFPQNLWGIYALIPMSSSRFAGDDTHMYGGADRDRTGDLRRAKPALSHLSYSPKNFSSGKIFDSVHPKIDFCGFPGSFWSLNQI